MIDMIKKIFINEKNFALSLFVVGLGLTLAGYGAVHDIILFFGWGCGFIAVIFAFWIGRYEGLKEVNKI